MTSPPTLLAQLSDPHIFVGLRDRAPAAALAAAVRAVLSMPRLPDAVLVSGDLTEDGAARSYERVRELLLPLRAPVFVLTGNHDDREALREYFALAEGSTGAIGGPFRYTARVGELRLIACDTTLPGRGNGSLGLEHRGWLEAELASDRFAPTVVAMHHPPIDVGLHEMDVDFGLDRGDRAALGELLFGRPQARRVVCGHVHRAATGAVGGCPVFTCASTNIQARLDFESPELAIADERPSFAVHALLDGAGGGGAVPPVEPPAGGGATTPVGTLARSELAQLVTHVQPIR